MRGGKLVIKNIEEGVLCRVGLETPGRWGRGCAETVCKLLQQGSGGRSGPQ